MIFIGSIEPNAGRKQKIVSLAVAQIQVVDNPYSSKAHDA